MFDVGFSELVMVALIALLVIGPERLPKAARIAGWWLGKARTTIASVKAEIKQELQAEEMRQLLEQQSVADELQRVVDDAKATVADINADLKTASEIQQHDDKSV